MSSFLTRPDKHNAHSVIALLAVGLLLLAVGWVIWSMMSGTSEPEIVEESDDESEEIIDLTESDEPSGYVYFTALNNSDDRRSVPMEYSFSDDTVEEIENDTDLHYAVTAPSELGWLHFTAPYVARENDDARPAFNTYLSLELPDSTIEPQVIMPGGIDTLDASGQIAFHGLSRSFADGTGHDDVFAGDDFLHIPNWSIYYIDDVESEEVHEVESGVSPVWNSDGTILYYVNMQGVMQYDVSSGLTEQITRFAEGSDIFNTSGVRLALSDDDSKLYVSYLSATAEDDFVVLYELEEDAPSANFVRQYDLPPGTYTQMTLSPDENFAGFMIYDSVRDNSITFKALDVTSEEVLIEEVFTIDTFGYYFTPQPVWAASRP